MVRGIGGAIVPNPDARWAISEATRDGIKQIISDGFEGELQPVNGGKRPPYLQPGENREGDIIDHIKAALDAEHGVSFERSRFMRARLIAGTEIGRAQTGSNLNLWRQSRVVKEIKWYCSEDDPCADCAKNNGMQVEFGKQFPSGAYSPLDTHPLCSCVICVVTTVF
jgi:hypothetical protein